MTRGVETTTVGTTLQATALTMREAAVGMLPVLDNEGPVGVITDRDIAVRATANGLDPNASHVGDVMTRRVVCCYEDETVEEAARRMEEHTIRRLVVLDREERMVGVVSLDDLACLPREARAGSILEE